VAAPSSKVPDRRQIGISLDGVHAEQLTNIADALTDGNKSNAVSLLLDKYAGKLIEFGVERQIQVDTPPPLIGWQAPKLSNELGAFIAGLVRAGNMPEVACNIAGVSPYQRRQWFKRGRADRTANKPSLYADFVAAVERAEAECEAEDIARLRKHGQTVWTAIAWRLERQYPDRYAQRKRIDGKVQHSMLPMVDWDKLDPRETTLLVELLRKASPEGDDPGVSRSARPAFELVPADVIEVVDGKAVDITDDDGLE